MTPPEESGKHLETRRLSNGKRLLLSDLKRNIDGDDWKVPEGFETDFSTIPQVAAWVVRWSRVDYAGTIHDYLYSAQPKSITRRRADRIWRIVAMRGEHGANRIQGWVCWLALRGFGGIAWAACRKTGAAWAVGLALALLSIAVLGGLVTAAVFSGWGTEILIAIAVLVLGTDLSTFFTRSVRTVPGNP